MPSAVLCWPAHGPSTARQLSCGGIVEQYHGHCNGEEDRHSGREVS